MPIGFHTVSKSVPNIKMEMPEEDDGSTMPPPPPTPPPPNPKPGPNPPPRPGAPGPVPTGNVDPNPGPIARSIVEGGRVFALLIGIDRYDYTFVDSQGRLRDIHLNGCVNDSREVERYLKENVAEPGKRLFLRKLRSTHDHNPEEMSATIQCASEELFPATRENILRSLRDFLGSAGMGDIVFIHYSGHGSFEFRPEQLQHVSRADNVSHQGGTLIAQDSFTTRDGAMIEAVSDLELRWLLHRISENGPHIASLMDCCYSAGNTRNFDDDGTTSRFAEPAPRLTANESGHTRPVSTYAFYQEDPGIRVILDSGNFRNFELPLADRAVSLSGCRENELSKEDLFPTGKHGVFTYYLLQALRATGGAVSYRDLVKLVRAKVTGNARISFQSPQIDANNPDDMDLQFLSGALAANSGLYDVRPGAHAGEGIMDAGALHGIASPGEGETHVELYPANVDIKTADPRTALKGVLTAVRAHESTVGLANGQTFPAGVAHLKAVVTAAPLPPTKVRLMTELNEREVDLDSLAENSAERIALTNGLNLLQAAAGESRFFQTAQAGEDYGYRIYAYVFNGEGKYRIARKDDVFALIEPRAGFNADTAAEVVGQMDHIARWEKTLKLEKKQFHRIQPGDVELTALDAETNAVLPSNNGEIILEQKKQPDGSWTKPKIKVQVNMKKPDEFYYASLIQLKRNFAIDTKNYLPSGAILGERVWIEDDREMREGRQTWFAAQEITDGQGRKRSFPGGLPIGFFADDPDALRAKGVDEVEEHFKLIVSTEEFDAFYLEQDGMELATTTRKAFSDARPKNQLEALMTEAGNGTRGPIEIPEEGEDPSTLPDWFAATLTIKTKFVE